MAPGAVLYSVPQQRLLTNIELYSPSLRRSAPQTTFKSMVPAVGLVLVQSRDCTYGLSSYVAYRDRRGQPRLTKTNLRKKEMGPNHFRGKKDAVAGRQGTRRLGKRPPRWKEPWTDPFTEKGSDGAYKVVGLPFNHFCPPPGSALSLPQFPIHLSQPSPAPQNPYETPKPAPSRHDERC